MQILNALEHHRAGRVSLAVQLYQRILQFDPSNAEALHLMGDAVGLLGDLDLSISLISRARAIAPKNTTYLASLGMAYRAKKQFDLALACYASVLEIEPNSALAFFDIGNTLQCQDRFEEATNNFTWALKINPDFIEARYNLANLQKSSGEFARAIDNYKIVLTAKPDFAAAFHNMSSALHAFGKPDEALLGYEQASCHKLPETHNNIGNIYSEKGHLQPALRCYEQAICGRPDYAEAYNNMGLTLRKLGQFQDAYTALSEAIRIMPDYAGAYINLGDVLLEVGLVDDAAIQYEHVTLIAPGLAQAHFNLGVARNSQGDLASARMCFEQALAARPGDLDTLYNLGVVDGLLMRTNEAERWYRQVLSLDPGYVSAHINLSAILMNDGRTLEAKKHIDLAYSRQNVFEKYAWGANKTVLILFDAGKGNLNLTHLFNKKTNNLIDWMIEYASEAQSDKLPAYDLVFNAMGDPDMTGDTIGPVSRFLDACTKPLLNHPHKVALTARNELPALLAGIDQLIVPAVWRFASSGDWPPSIVAKLPLLIRPVHTHGGVGLVLATSAAELAQCSTMHSGPVYVSCFVDYRSADSWYRKYRMIFIDRKPYPYHLAISQNWLVHYYTADMEPHPWKKKEEEEFLQHPEIVLGIAGMQAIEAIGVKLDLDYAGIDFSIMPDGRILVFEANPTMLVHPEIVAGTLGHKNFHVQQIFDAFEGMLESAIGLVPKRVAGPEREVAPH